MSDRALLVEGQDDRHVVRQIRAKSRELQDIPDFEILDKDGITNLVAAIRFEVVDPRRLAVGLIVDANNHLQRRWEQLTGRLKSADVDLPQLPDADGTIVQGRPDGVSRGHRVGIWLMPDNAATGELETFVQSMIPEDDPVWPLSEDYIERIPDDSRKFRDKATRAKVHAWLATREDPRLMGAAIGADDLRTDGPLSQTFVGWLRRLFE